MFCWILSVLASWERLHWLSCVMLLVFTVIPDKNVGCRILDWKIILVRIFKVLFYCPLATVLILDILCVTCLCPPPLQIWEYSLYSFVLKFHDVVSWYKFSSSLIWVFSGAFQHRGLCLLIKEVFLHYFFDSLPLLFLCSLSVNFIRWALYLWNYFSNLVSI